MKSILTHNGPNEVNNGIPCLDVGKFLKDDGTWDVVSAASTFVELTDTPAAYTGDALKVVRVNAAETALEFVTLAGGGDMLGSNNLSDVANAATARTNLGIESTANQTDSADKRFMSDAQEAIVDGVTGALSGKLDTTAFSGLTKISVGTSTPVGPTTGDLWVDTN